jgi:hypothetical protein
MIQPSEWEELTEPSFFRPEVGVSYRVILSNWRYERRTTKFTNGERGFFVADVISVNGERPGTGREFSTSNKMLCKQLYASVKLAEEEGRRILTLQLSRNDHRTYTVVDMDIVHRAASRSPVRREPTPENDAALSAASYR